MDIHKLASQVKLFILDVDGVLTDGKIYILPDGNEVKVFNTLDGHGIKMLNRINIQTAIITGRDSQATAFRARQLGINHYFAGVSDKLSVFNELIAKTKIPAQNCAFMGDDLPDLPLLNTVGFSIAPSNACDIVKSSVDLITQKSGGNGAVREVCDLILSAQNIDSNYEVMHKT